MLDQWIERCTLQRVSLHEGLVLSFEDYNEVVISRPLRLGLPPVGPYPAEVVVLAASRTEALALLDRQGGWNIDELQRIEPEIIPLDEARVLASHLDFQ